MLTMLSVRLLMNSRLLVVKFFKSQKVIRDFGMCRVVGALDPHIVFIQSFHLILPFPPPPRAPPPKDLTTNGW